MLRSPFTLAEFWPNELSGFLRNFLSLYFYFYTYTDRLLLEALWKRCCSLIVHEPEVILKMVVILRFTGKVNAVPVKTGRIFFLFFFFFLTWQVILKFGRDNERPDNPRNQWMTRHIYTLPNFKMIYRNTVKLVWNRYKNGQTRGKE